MPHDTSFSVRHLEMAEELRDFLAEALPPPTSVQRGYAPDLEKIPPTGLLVWVIPTTEADVRRLARRRVETEYTFVFAVARRYEEALQQTGHEPVPLQWVDENCGWVWNNVYKPLNDRVLKKDRIIPTAVPQTCTLTVKYDPDRLATGLFWSVVTLALREERRA